MGSIFEATKIDPERWRRVEEMFQAVVRLDPGERSAYLMAVAAEDQELRRDVERLLAADELHPGEGTDVVRLHRLDELCRVALPLSPQERDELLDMVCGDDGDLRREAKEVFASRTAADAARLAATDEQTIDLADHRTRPEELRLGPYRVLHEIGEGGMAKVYLAVRDDQEYQQRVAIKILHRGLYSQTAAQRFRQERQILAGLDHPAIARLIDGGTTPNGAPYLVMEYIEGRPVDRYCQEMQLSLEERLQLFLKILSAVQHAHQNLIVHRDLKPSNILVRYDGAPKLLDFGIAKLLNPELGSGVDPTRADLLILTPTYASPEQVMGAAVTTASDVYSLGVVLFNMLTGAAPYSITTGSVQEIVLAVCDQEPPPASRKAANPQLARRLRGDLDQILHKALAKSPPERYATVDSFAHDLRCYLDGLPVSAHPAGLVSRAWKAVRRHRLTSALVATLVLLAAAFIGNTMLQSARIAQTLAVAEQERATAQSINSFLLNLLSSADPAIGEGRNVTVYDAFQNAESAIEEELAGDPEVEVAVRTAIGDVYDELGHSADAEKMYRRALAIRRHQGREEEVAELLNRLGVTLVGLDRAEEAELLLEEALSISSELHGPNHPGTLKIVGNLGVACRYQGKLDEAEQCYRTALAGFRANPSSSAEATAGALQNLATIHAMRGEYEAASASFGEAFQELRDRYGADHPGLSVVQSNLGLLNRILGDYETAEQAYLSCIDQRVRLLGEGSPLVARCRLGYSEVLAIRGRYHQAEQELSLAEAVMHEALGERHPDYHDVLIAAANTQVLQGHLESAADSLRRARLVISRAEAAETEYLVAQESTACRLALARGQVPAAERSARQAYQIRLQTLGPAHRDVAEMQILLADVLCRSERFLEAEELYTSAIAVLEPQVRATAIELLQARLGLGICYAAGHRTADARRQLEQVRRWLPEVQPKQSSLRGLLRSALAELPAGA